MGLEFRAEPVTSTKILNANASPDWKCNNGFSGV